MGKSVLGECFLRRRRNLSTLDPLERASPSAGIASDALQERAARPPFAEIGRYETPALMVSRTFRQPGRRAASRPQEISRRVVSLAFEGRGPRAQSTHSSDASAGQQAAPQGRGMCSTNVDRAGHYRLAAATNEGRRDYAVYLFRNGMQKARSSKIDALPNGGLQLQRHFASQVGEESDKRDVRAAGRRVFEDTVQRREHPRLKVRALFCVLDVQMNSSDLVSRQV